MALFPQIAGGLDPEGEVTVKAPMHAPVADVMGRVFSTKSYLKKQMSENARREKKTCDFSKCGQRRRRVFF